MYGENSTLTLSWLIECPSSTGVADHGMMLKVSDRNLGDPFFVLQWERGEVKVQPLEEFQPSCKTAREKFKDKGWKSEQSVVE